jgi:hypothetical protein
LCPGRRGSHRKNPAKDTAGILVNWDPSFVVELPQRDSDCPLILTKVPQGIDRETETLADAHSSPAEKEQTIRAQIVVFSELLLEFTVIFGRKWFGEVLIARRAIFQDKESFPQAVVVAHSQVVEQPPDSNDGAQPS